MQYQYARDSSGTSLFADAGESAISQVPPAGDILVVTLTSKDKYCVTNRITVP